MDKDDLPVVGVTGLGEMGKIYAEIALAAGCRVVGTDVNANLRREFRDVTGADTFEDYVEMYDEVDAVVVTTPNKYHEKAALPAFERDLAVYIEKPLAHTHESAARIADAAEETDAVCMLSYNIPFFDLGRYLVDAIERGELGEIMHIEARNVHRRHVPRSGSWFTSKEIAGGGVLQDKGSFVLDMLFEFGVGDVVAATAVARNEFKRINDVTSIGSRWAESDHGDMFDVEDSMTVFLEFDGGTTATVETAWATNAAEDHSYRVRGTDGGAYLDVLANDLTFYETGRAFTDNLFNNTVEALNDDSPRYHDPDHYPLPEKAFHHFLECVQTNRPPEYGTLARGLRVQRAIERIYDAAES